MKWNWYSVLASHNYNILEVKEVKILNETKDIDI